MKRLILFISLLSLTLSLFSQNVGINLTGSDPDSSAILDVQSTNQGMLLPRMNTAQRNAIKNPALGLRIFNTDDSCFNYYSGQVWFQDCGTIDSSTAISPASSGGGNNDIAYAISTDQEGNRYITGEFFGVANFGSTALTSSGLKDIFVAKIDPSGNYLWAVRAGGGTAFDRGNGISTDANGNCYLTGEFGGTASFGATSLTASGTSDIFIAKLNSSGQFQWAVKAGGTSSNGQADYGAAIATDAAGNSVVAGEFDGSASFGSINLTGNGNDEAFVLKINSSGQIQWAVNAGGTSEDLATGIAMDAAGNSYVTGGFAGTASFGSNSLTSSGSLDIFVAKLDPAGQFLWATKGGGNGFDFPRGIAVDAMGNSHIIGEFTGSAGFGGTTLTSAGSRDIYIAKINSSGAFQWVSSAGGTSVDFGRAITVDSRGNSYVSGDFVGNATFGQKTLSTPNGPDIFVCKLDSSGQIGWAQLAGGTGIDIGYGITTDPNGNIISTGQFQGTVDFGGTTLTSSGAIDVFVWAIEPLFGLNAINTNSVTEVQSSLRDNLGNHTATQSLGMGDSAIYLRGSSDDKHALRYSGAASKFANYNPDGPVLYGNNGGILGTKYFGTENIALTWFRNGNIYLYNNILSLRETGQLGTALRYAGATSQFANFNPDGPVLHGGAGGILGTTMGGEKSIITWNHNGQVNVDATLRLNDSALYLRGGTDVKHGLRYAGSNSPFASLTPDGPVLYGNSGGALGVNSFGNERLVLSWTSNGDIYLNNNILLLSTLNRFGSALRLADSTSLFGGANPDGPVLHGSAGGILGTTLGGEKSIISWNSDRQVNVDASLRMSDNPIYLRGGSDGNHVLRYVGSTSQFANVNPNGPVLHGYSGGILGTTNGGEKGVLFWDWDGNVGIGVDTPSTSLHIRADAPTTSGAMTIENTDSTGFAGIYFNDIDGTRKGWMGWTNSTSGLAGPNTLQMGASSGPGFGYIAISPTTGNVGIGVTNPSSRLQVGKNGDGSFARANQWATWSDSTLKRDFQELANPLDMLAHINGYHYYWKEGAEDTSLQVGVMAQEIEHVLPELVSIDEQGIRSVDYSRLTALLIEVNQAQESVMEAQQAEIEALKAELQQTQQANQQTLEAFEARLQQTHEAHSEMMEALAYRLQLLEAQLSTSSIGTADR